MADILLAFERAIKHQNRPITAEARPFCPLLPHFSGPVHNTLLHNNMHYGGLKININTYYQSLLT